MPTQLAHTPLFAKEGQGVVMRKVSYPVVIRLHLCYHYTHLFIYLAT